jgi:hypothetical protein
MVPSPPQWLFPVWMYHINLYFRNIINPCSGIQHKIQPSLFASEVANFWFINSPATGLTINMIFFSRFYFFYWLKIINFQHTSKVVNKMRPILKLYWLCKWARTNCDGTCFKPTTKRLRFSFKKLRNARSVISMFRIKTQSNAWYLVHNDIKIHTKH